MPYCAQEACSALPRNRFAFLFAPFLPSGRCSAPDAARRQLLTTAHLHGRHHPCFKESREVQGFCEYFTNPLPRESLSFCPGCDKPPS